MNKKGSYRFETQVIHAAQSPEDWKGSLYRPMPRGQLKEVNISLIPYYAWANRGPAEMTIWIPMT